MLHEGIFASIFFVILYAAVNKFADEIRRRVQGVLEATFLKPLMRAWKDLFTGKPLAFKYANVILCIYLLFAVWQGISFSCGLIRSKDFLCILAPSWKAMSTHYLFWSRLFTTVCMFTVGALLVYPGTLIEVDGKKIPVTSRSVDLELVKAWRPFKDWCEKIGNEPRFRLKYITFQDLDTFGARVGFLKFESTVVTKDSDDKAEKLPGAIPKALPGIVFMRGPSMGVLMLVKCGGELYTIMTLQPRLAVPTTSMAEIPAGILDTNGHFQSQARNDIETTTGITINDKHFVNMTEMVYGSNFPGIYPTCGCSDEYFQLYLYQHPDELNGGKLLELLRSKPLERIAHEIKVQVISVPYDKILMHSADSKAVCAVHLFEKLVADGKIEPLIPLSAIRSKIARKDYKGKNLELKQKSQSLEWEGNKASARAGSNHVIVAGSLIPLSVAAGQDIDIESAKCAPFFKDWLVELEYANHPKKVIDVKSIEFQSHDKFGTKHGFLKINANAISEGREIPGIVFMRGGSVGILVMLKCQDELYVVMCQQARVAVGHYEFLEIPAGIAENGAFAGFAANELREETSIIVNPKKLVDMTQKVYENTFKGVYASCGGSDEYYRIFLHFQTCSMETLTKIQSFEQVRNTGYEGEKITLKLVPYKVLLRETADCKTLIAAHLYEKLLEWGELDSVVC